MGDVQDTLNDLISICRHSENDFGKAAKGASREDLRKRFAGTARQRALFADELLAYVRKIGGESAAVQPSAVRPNGGREPDGDVQDDAWILADCEASEENALHHYERALSKDLPVPVRPIVDRHRLAVQEALLDLRSMEQVRRAS